MLWKTWLQSKTLRTRPSDLLGITGVYRQWCFDEACAEWGQACEAEMDRARQTKSKGKKQPSVAQQNAKAENALRKMLGMKQQFQDIRALTKEV